MAMPSALRSRPRRRASVSTAARSLVPSTSTTPRSCMTASDQLDDGAAAPPCASVHECPLSRVSEEAARAASSVLAMVDTAERLLDRDLEASDYAGVAASRE